MKRDRDLRASLREPHDEARAHANWEAIDRRRRRTPSVASGRAPLFGGIAVGLAAAAVVVLFVVRSPAPGPLVQEDGRVASGPIDGSGVTLDDGSRVAIEPGARLEILENAGDHIRFWLHEGAARFDVVPGGPRRWVIESGLVTVEVLGTAFTVEHGSEEVRVSVERGSVLVRGPTAPDGMRRLAAGESLSVPTGERPVVTAAASDPAPVVLPLPTDPGLAPPRATERDRARDVPAEEAAAPPPVDVAPEVETAEAPAAARLRDADALRAAGHLDEAIALLETIAEDPTAGNERALAAFTRARLELDRRHRPGEAAAAFAQAIALGLREPLLEDARAGRVEALSLAADAAGARAARDEYLTHHPEGRWRSEVERWSGAP